ncbi:hypothetical protein LTR91_000303 [Friedmanniomyces endolithicus]|uniref:PLC-like phosphodiesterase n=1 Tax=Friedmanniomyces endolithicus TaxID=329885 RepID=A0AAN6FHQ1_9PEZI|nr:hypothetical protein LTR35_010147 [Friedmanniomyces endolithicus]KAK0298366.1 hypothetical protein LTS00_003331 [Friedmanniomyces endolithicus]KAK0317379.1 hypothetical protein LTR82_011702 [Friedmanniomyces endolithicus]KAK0931353.1 hypothetical protein LTR57_000768 [Friedmanniomyces endolithicus]KAK1010853.1 hypothetical protein LTS01_001545 [Friedmanniomyces endolithicus]
MSNGTVASTSDSQSTRSQSSNSLLNIAGTASSRPSNATATTSSAPLPSNTLPCNNHPEFCNRKYSNITEVCAHNSAFDIKNNAASNQALSISDQLNDGIRMLQGETHFVNNTIYNCHTTCSLLNAGTWQTMLETLVTWLESNPYDVVTVLIVNSDFVEVGNYTAPVENSGIRNYLYEPEYVPQHRDQWPTLGQMILSGKRVVMFMDYNANQTTVPYILDEFSHIFETPFSPTNQSFPCTEQRPPHLDPKKAKDEYMYLANHNLNTAVDLGALTGGSSSESLLIPTYSQLNITNGAENQLGQLEAMRQNCTREWDRPPNFLLVDYYNDGTPSPGSVFEVAARANGVTYNRRCCGYAVQSAAPALRSSYVALAIAMVFVTLLAW